MDEEDDDEQSEMAPMHVSRRGLVAHGIAFPEQVEKEPHKRVSNENEKDAAHATVEAMLAAGEHRLVGAVLGGPKRILSDGRHIPQHMHMLLSSSLALQNQPELIQYGWICRGAGTENACRQRKQLPAYTC